jgi:hypothetical protein
MQVSVNYLHGIGGYISENLKGNLEKFIFIIFKQNNFFIPPLNGTYFERLEIQSKIRSWNKRLM